MPWFEITLFGALCAIAWFWVDAIRAREAGINAVRSACEREGVQLLDDTVAMRRLRTGRNDSGHLVLRRVYEFEYSGSGDDRRKGSVVLLGKQVVMMDVAKASQRTLQIVID